MESACEAVTKAVADILDVPEWNNTHVLPCSMQLVKAVKLLIKTSKLSCPQTSDLQESLGSATKIFVEETRKLLNEQKTVPHAGLLKVVNDITRMNDALKAIASDAKFIANSSEVKTTGSPTTDEKEEKKNLLCHFCGLTISKRHVTLYDKTFHLKCFKCKCGTECDPRSRLFAGPEGFPICSKCTPRCSGCGESVTGSHIVPVAGKQYHPQCLACEVCKKKMPIEDLGLTNKVICCEKCSHAASNIDQPTELDTLLNTLRFSAYSARFKEVGVTKLSQLAVWKPKDYDNINVPPAHRDLICSVLKLIEAKISEQPKPPPESELEPVKRTPIPNKPTEKPEKPVKGFSQTSISLDSKGKAPFQAPVNVTFDLILRNEKGVEAWVKFCCEQKKPETIFFWLEIEVFRAYMGPPSAVAEYANNISAKYLSPNAEHLVYCIDEDVRNKTIANLPIADSQFYDQLQDLVFRYMEQSIWPTFVSNEKGIEILNELSQLL